MERAEVFDENGDWTLKSKHLERWRPTPFLNTYLAGPKPPEQAPRYSTLSLIGLTYCM